MPPKDRISHRHILVAEDDPAIMELISIHLEAAGYHVVEAVNGLEAYRKLQSVRPTALILDLNMPKLDGFGVLERMRGVPDMARIPTLVLTARRSADDVKRALSLGALDYLVKPFDAARLIDRVGRLVRSRPPSQLAAIHQPPPEIDDHLMI